MRVVLFKKNKEIASLKKKNGRLEGRLEDDDFVEETVTKTQKKLLAAEKLVSKLSGDKEKLKLKVSK